MSELFDKVRGKLRELGKRREEAKAKAEEAKTKAKEEHEREAIRREGHPQPAR